MNGGLTTKGGHGLIRTFIVSLKYTFTQLTRFTLLLKYFSSLYEILSLANEIYTALIS